MKRKWILLILLGLLLAAGVGLGLRQTGLVGQAAAAATAAPGYQTTTARQGSITISVSGAGTLVSSRAVDLAFPASEEVAELKVQVGDSVKAGQALAVQADSPALKLAVQQARTNLLAAQQTLSNLTARDGSTLAQSLADWSAAQANYAKAKANVRKTGQGRCEKSVTEMYYYQWLDLQKELSPWQQALDDGNSGYGRDFILEHLQPLWKKSSAAWANYNYCQTFTSEEVETSQAALQLAEAKMNQAGRDYQALKTAKGIDTTELEIAQAALDSAVLQLAQAQANLDGAVMTAPVDATVTAVNGEVGEPSGTDTFITLTDLDHPQVQINIDETDLQNFTSGCPAAVSFDSVSGQSFSGIVSQVSPALVDVRGVSMAQGLIDLEQNRTLAGKVLPLGLTATAEITCSQVNDTLVVAAQAVYFPPEGSPYVYLPDAAGQPVKREVQVGLKTVALAEILSGLQPGDQVILSAVE